MVPRWSPSTFSQCLCKMCVRGSKKVQNDGADWLREEYLEVQGWANRQNLLKTWLHSTYCPRLVTQEVCVCGAWGWEGEMLSAPFTRKCSLSSTEKEKGFKNAAWALFVSTWLLCDTFRVDHSLICNSRANWGETEKGLERSKVGLTAVH